MKNLRPTYILLAVLAVLAASAWPARAQQFSVASFRALPNDVSAFINPVRDLNDEDCGLIKVTAPDDFAFSTPLDIVKREDKVGEIWLYIPHGSKKITLKHPEWGVLRDYVFPCRIDSHMSYELRVDIPVKAVAEAAVGPVVTTVRDTLVVTRVDTLVVVPEKKRVPWIFGGALTGGYGGKSKQALGGVMLMAAKRHGAFAHLSADFGKIGATVGSCDADGSIDGHLPFYTGRTRRSTLIINAGAVHRLSGTVYVYEGLGYGRTGRAWELAPSQGGGYVKNRHYDTRGISFEAGAIVRIRRVALTASVTSIKGREWYGTIGVGITFGK